MGKSKLARREAIRGFLFIAPAFIMLFAFIMFPIIRGFGFSFTDYNLLKSWDRNIIGFVNYTKALSDPDFYQVLGNVVKFAFGVTIVSVILSMAIALLLNSVTKCKNIIRSLVFMPWVLPEVVVGSIWRWILNGDKGLLNSILADRLQIMDSYIQWFSAGFALLSVGVVYVWRTYPFVTIMLSAGLSSIDREIYEAADIDGCGKVQRFWYITLPQLKYVLTICSLMALIWSMNGFGILNILTAGGPGLSSTTLPILIYKTAFQKFRFGLAATYSVIQFAIIMVFSIIYLKITKAAGED